MLLPSLFVYRVGPVLQLDLLSHFSHVCTGKNKEQRLICFFFFDDNYVARDLTDDPLIFVAQSVAQQKIFRAEDHRSGLDYSDSDSVSELEDSESEQ